MAGRIGAGPIDAREMATLLLAICRAVLGIHEAGEPILLGYQTAGFSHSGEIPGWRTFITTAIGEVDVTDRSFAGPRSDWNPYGHTMLEIFARA